MRISKSSHGAMPRARSKQAGRMLRGIVAACAAVGMVAVAPMTTAQAADLGVTLPSDDVPDSKALDLARFYWHCYVLMWTDPARQFAECGTSFPHEWHMTEPNENNPDLPHHYTRDNNPPPDDGDPCDKGQAAAFIIAPSGPELPATGRAVYQADSSVPAVFLPVIAEGPGGSCPPFFGQNT